MYDVTLMGTWRPYPAWAVADMLGLSEQEVTQALGDTPWVLETLLGPREVRSRPPHPET